MTVGKGCEIVTLEEVEHALTQQIGDDADVIPKVETIPEMDALVAVLRIVQGEGPQDAQLDARSVSVFLDGSNDLDGTFGPLALVVGLDDLPKRTLTKQTTDLIFFPNQRLCLLVAVSPRPTGRRRRRRPTKRMRRREHTTVSQGRVGNDHVVSIFIIHPLISHRRILNPQATLVPSPCG